MQRFCRAREVSLYKNTTGRQAAPCVVRLPHPHPSWWGLHGTGEATVATAGRSTTNPPNSFAIPRAFPSLQLVLLQRPPQRGESCSPRVPGVELEESGQVTMVWDLRLPAQSSGNTATSARNKEARRIHFVTTFLIYSVARELWGPDARWRSLASSSVLQSSLRRRLTVCLGLAGLQGAMWQSLPALQQHSSILPIQKLLWIYN